ncbi:MAG: hypothetical protein E6I18_03340 [Chloroflexi bacterium]|nr:MAG: hypothetical protein E6I18_03340 [Chloroflexota bacterium]
MCQYAVRRIGWRKLRHREKRLEITRASGDERTPGTTVTATGCGGSLTFDLVLNPPAVEVRPLALAQVVEELPLSRREKELLLEVGKGKTNAAIARTLGISPATVKKHLEHIYEKLGVSGRVAALARALAVRISTVIAAYSASALLSDLGEIGELFD